MLTHGMGQIGTEKRIRHTRSPQMNRAKAGKITDHALMIALYNEGRRTAEIAAYFGVKSPAITRALNDAGVQVRRMTPVRDDHLAELVAEGARAAMTPCSPSCAGWSRRGGGVRREPG